jgi:hypothetical protein
LFSSVTGYLNLKEFLVLKAILADYPPIRSKNFFLLSAFFDRHFPPACAAMVVTRFQIDNLARRTATDIFGPGSCGMLGKPSLNIGTDARIEGTV